MGSSMIMQTTFNCSRIGVMANHRLTLSVDTVGSLFIIAILIICGKLKLP